MIIKLAISSFEIPCLFLKGILKGFRLNEKNIDSHNESDTTLSLKLGLEHYGFMVSTYNDPILALSEFKAGLYNLLIADIRTAGMSGLELYEKIKQIDNRIEDAL